MCQSVVTYLSMAACTRPPRVLYKVVSKLPVLGTNYCAMLTYPARIRHHEETCYDSE